MTQSSTLLVELASHQEGVLVALRGKSWVSKGEN
jgi:hypothetical protein